MKQKFMLIIIVVFLAIIISNLAEAQNISELSEPGLNRELIQRELDKLNIDDLEKEINKLNNRSDKLFPDVTIGKIINSFFSGGTIVDSKQLMKGIVSGLLQEFLLHGRLLGQIFILMIITTLLNLFIPERSSISELAGKIILFIIAYLLLSNFQDVVIEASDAITNMVTFMQSLIPVILTLLVGTGALASAAVFHPLTYLVITLFSTIIKTVVLPLLLISAVLEFVNLISRDFSFSRLTSLFKEFSIGLTGVLLMVFTGGMFLQGGAAAIGDSLTLRTAKYVTGMAIPFLGGLFADTVDIMVNCVLLLKNALNLAGIIVIIFITAYPILKILALLFVYKLAGAFLEPVTDHRGVILLNKLAGNLVLLILALMSVAFMFFIALTIVVGTANFTVMMR